MSGGAGAENQRAQAAAPDLIEHCFRHEYGRLVAVLTRKVGARHLELVEDAVQASLVAALTAWNRDGVPEEPGAWLYRVAFNHVLEDLRRGARRRRILEHSIDPTDGIANLESASFAGEVQDDLLRMLFVCCDDEMPRASCVALVLKTLCGFSTAEIAHRLFTSEANVYKRLARARQHLRRSLLDLQTPSLDALTSRLPGVHTVLYLLFTEGYLSTHPDHAIRRELCDEAIRLTTLLVEHAAAAVPETFALLALMHLHAARLGARCDATGGLLLLEEQDRSLWDADRMRLGTAWLARSAAGDVFSRYHAEAAIAAEHCFAPSFAETRWHEIADLYAMLEHIAPSALHTLNRAVAIAEWRGAKAGLALLEGLVPPAWLAGSYLWDAVLADLHRRAGHAETARRHAKWALMSAPTDAVRDLLRRRLADGAMRAPRWTLRRSAP